MADTTAKKNIFITKFREEVEKMLSSSMNLKALIAEHTALSYSTVLADADFTGLNDHMTKAQLDAAVYLLDQLFVANASPQGDAVLFAIRR